MEAGRQRWRTGWTDDRKDEVGRGEEETVFCREGMKEGRGKNKRQISFHISLVGCEREMEKNDGMGSQEEEVGMTGYKHVQDDK